MRTQLLFLLAFLSFLQAALGQMPLPPSQGQPTKLIIVSLPSNRVQSPIVTVNFSGEGLDDVSAVAVYYDENPGKPGPLSQGQIQKMYEAAQWQPLQRRLELDLGKKDGERDLWFGFRHDSGRFTWRMHRITIDTTPPDIVVISPPGRVVSEPVIEILGYVPEAATSITFDDGSLPAGAQPKSAIILERSTDRDRGVIGKTTFKCPEVRLREGLNTISLKAVDFAGNANEKTFAITLDLKNDDVPPKIKIHWPNKDDEIYGKSFRPRGKLDAPTATVTVRGESARDIQATVDPKGYFWFPEIPVQPGRNVFTLLATDPAGNTASETFEAAKSDVEVTIDKEPEQDPKTRLLKVSGSISHPGYAVWVNGVKASVAGGRWTAEKVPLPENNTVGLIQAIPIPDSVNGGNGFGAPRKPRLEDMGNPRRNRSADQD